MVAQYLVGKENASIKQILLICADWKQTIVGFTVDMSWLKANHCGFYCWYALIESKPLWVLLLTTAYYLKATKTYKADNCEKYQHHYFYIFHFVLSQFSPTWDH